MELHNAQSGNTQLFPLQATKWFFLLYSLWKITGLNTILFIEYYQFTFENILNNWE